MKQQDRQQLVVTNQEVEQTVQDLGGRWTRAREAAFFQVVGEKKGERESLQNLKLMSEESFESLLKAVFLNSRNLGRSYQKSHQVAWELSDFEIFAPRLGGPCLKGLWEDRPTAKVLVRAGCPSGSEGGPRVCQYWREAIDGLTVGISDDVGFVRHECLPSGNESCLDVFFQDEVSPTDAIWSNSHKWGTIPGSMQADLDAIQRRFHAMKIDLTFLGLVEKEIIYKLEPREKLTCGTEGASYRTHLAELVKLKFPHLKLKDASPVAVYGERA